jgi:hypothetical protein
MFKPRPRKEVPHPPCTICGGEVPRLITDIPSAYLRRTACSDACRREQRRRGIAEAATRPLWQPSPEQVRPCDHCGQPIPWTPHPQRNHSHYRLQRYCSKACNNAAWQSQPGEASRVAQIGRDPEHQAWMAAGKALARSKEARR